MLNSFSLAQIEFLKRKAKTLSRTASLTHSQALDRVAAECGFKNWSLLAKRAASLGSDVLVSNNPVLEEDTQPVQLAFTRTPEEMRNALRVIQVSRHEYHTFEKAARRTENICRKFASPANALDFAVRYMECLLTVPRYRVRGGSVVYPEMRCWLPYHTKPLGDDAYILTNRYYKPVGDTGREWVRYEDYQHLHFHMDKGATLLFAHQGSSPDYLFNDGCPPWHSRKDAEVYLDRLRILQGLSSN